MGKSYRFGSTVPIKLQIVDDFNNFISGAKIRLYVGDSPAVSSGLANGINNYFRYDYSSNQYIFNLSTKRVGLDTARYDLSVRFEDDYSCPISVSIK